MQELFIKNEPKPRGQLGRLNPVLTLADAAKLSEQLEQASIDSAAKCNHAVVLPAAKSTVKTPSTAAQTPITCSPKDQYPICKMVPCWFCSDDEEYGNEVAALRHEVELLQAAGFKRRINR